MGRGSARETPLPGETPQGDPLARETPCQGEPPQGDPPARETPLQGDPPSQGDPPPGRPPARETPTCQGDPNLPGRPQPARETPTCQGDPTSPGRTPLPGRPPSGPQSWGKLRGIRSRPTAKGEIEGDQIQAHIQGGN